MEVRQRRHIADETKVPEYEKERSRLDNGIFVCEHCETLLKIHRALKFSGTAFLALGAAQLIFESTIIASLDEFAFGIFLLDAAHRIRRLAANLALKPAADELNSALISIGDTHGILGWVTSYQTFSILSSFFGLQHLALSSAYYQYLIKSFESFSQNFPFLLIFIKILLALIGLRFGGLSYFRTKIDYWSRASSLGANLLTDKVSRLLGHRPSLNQSAFSTTRTKNNQRQYPSAKTL